MLSDDQEADFLGPRAFPILSSPMAQDQEEDTREEKWLFQQDSKERGCAEFRPRRC